MGRALAFVATGLLGATWLISWLLIGGRTPSLRVAPPPDTDGDRPRLGDPRLWGFMALYALGAFPLAGFFGNGEIAHDRLYGYTGVLALFL